MVKIKTSSALYLFLIKHIMQQIIVELTVKRCFFIGQRKKLTDSFVGD